MSQILIQKFKGLHTYPNELSEVPEGAAVKAENVVIDAESKVQSRRGFKKYGIGFGSGTDRCKAIIPFKNKKIIHYDNKLAYDSVGDGSVWSVYSGTFNAPTNTVIRGLESNSNLYITTDNGLKKLDAIAGSFMASGVPKGLEILATLNAASGGFLVNGNQCAYIMIWGYKDANNNLILGSPSARVVVNNGSGVDKDVDIEFSIPSGITTSFFYQVYRSKEGTTTPSTDYYLIYEANPTSSEITNKKVSFTDNLPTSLNKGLLAYTSRSREGILGANEQAPYAEDMAMFKNMAFLANIKRKHQKYLTLLSVGGSDGIQNGDILTVAGVQYHADTSAEYQPTSISDTSPCKFKMSASVSAATKIEETALSLVKMINRNPHNSTVYAYYVSGVDDLPGQILIESRTLSGSSFTIQANANGDAYNPDVTSAITSSNEEKKNALVWSKLNEPEAFPLTNYATIGAADKAILRILAVRDSLFVLKEDGIWRVTGDTPSNLQITLFDNTTKLVARETAVVLSNQIYMFSDQGVVTVSDTGVAIISRPIEGELLQLSSDLATYFPSVSFAVAYETERKYMLFTISTVSDSVNTKCYVYNTFTNSWVTSTKVGSVGLVDPANDKLYLAETSSNELREERKNFDVRDYSDEDFAITISSYNSTTKVLTVSSTTGITDGMFIVQGSLEAKVDDVLSSTELLLTTNVAFTAGAASAYNLIRCQYTLAPQHGGNSAVKKQFREISLIMGSTRFVDAAIIFTSDLNASEVTNTVYGQPYTKWGQFPWGSVPWGGRKDRKPIRTLVPFAHQRCQWLNVSFVHQSAFEVFELLAVSLQFSPMSEKVGR